MLQNKILRGILLTGLSITLVVSSAVGITFADSHTEHYHEIEYCPNGDGTHYVYCTDGDCDYERIEECAYIEGYCPYCDYEYPCEDIDEAPDYSDNPDYASSYHKYDGYDYDYINDAGKGIETTDIFGVDYYIGDVDEDGGIVTDWYYFTPQDVIILAQVMRHEAGNQPEAGKIAVVEVILNRVRSPYFKQDTVSGIVYAPKQFSYVERSKKTVPTEYELELVRDIILGQKRVFNDPEILYFRNTEVTSGFSNACAVDWGTHKYATYIGEHSFYYQ